MCFPIAFNWTMDVFLIRRERLRQLIADDFKGNQAAFSERTKYKAPQINRWLSTKAASLRNITEQSAREIESRAGKPKGWLDVRESIPIDRRVRAVSAVAFTQDEMDLLDGFRLADDVTRRHMLRMAADSIQDFGKRSGENSL